MADVSTKNPARVCRIEDLFAVDGSPPPELTEALTAYLSAFAAPVRRDGEMRCLCCDEPINGLRAALGIGVACRWALTHGEAACSGCGWPARGMHYVTDADGRKVATLRNVFLAYHPDQVVRAPAVEAEHA
ncbi:hypothetical protein [Methylobacterium nodulans]|uniref:Uncharacterized protein n=1 Tax=Methylobacterium nodulans (strain LMG 21967 / CNCM I-2342 / ORS 2060) TaxID=460265 RepID=B8IRH2_METNO|nr:hypothetical protein [Methylobacterium nodulans]ACL58712.1 hypothetical protein Mnod_3812 [Methylobacterium nodulans ORS 2060]